MTTISIHRTSRLRVSDNRRYLVTETGEPFFWLGDTAWELFHRLTREEVDLYLRTRAAQRFSVIQAVALAEHGGLTVPNAYGHLPLEQDDPAKPVEAYFAHIDYVVKRAAALGLYIGLLPTWGDKVSKAWGEGPEIFTPENAAAYGAYLGRRYRDQPVIWILGGDRAVENPRQAAIWRAMAAAIAEHGGGRQLMTYHPQGQHCSSEWFHGDAWLDFNLWQRGHGVDGDVWRTIAETYAKTPPKPVLDGEPSYEDHPIDAKPDSGRVSAYDVRKYAYWEVFAGACGHTYGHHSVWQFLTPERAPISHARGSWRDALHHPGAEALHHLRQLMEGRPYLCRIPDQGMLGGDALSGGARIQATRGADGPNGASGSYAFVYSAAGKPFKVDLSKLTGSMVEAAWFDPRTGQSTWLGQFSVRGHRAFTPPSGEDWVLVLDDSTRNYVQIGFGGERRSSS
jgi:hypothetical protein